MIAPWRRDWPELFLGGDQPDVAHQLLGVLEPSEVLNLGAQSDRGQRVSLTRAGESGRGRVGLVMGLWGLGAGSLSAFRLGRRLQSSIRSRGADQSVVRCSGAQSTSRPSSSGSEGGQTQERARPSMHLAPSCARVWCELVLVMPPRPARVVVVVDGLLFEAADLAVAQAVVAEGEDLAGDGDLGDVAPAAFGDPLEGGTQWPVAGGDLLGGLGQRPAQRGRSLAGDVPQPGPCRRSCGRSAPAPPTHTSAGR